MRTTTRTPEGLQEIPNPCRSPRVLSSSPCRGGFEKERVFPGVRKERSPLANLPPPLWGGRAIGTANRRICLTDLRDACKDQDKSPHSKRAVLHLMQLKRVALLITPDLSEVSAESSAGIEIAYRVFQWGR